MSSAYVIMLSAGFVGLGMSIMYMLKSVGESTPPCGTPQWKRLLVDWVLL